MEPWEVEPVESKLAPDAVNRLLKHNEVLRDNLDEVNTMIAYIEDDDLMLAKGVWQDFTEYEQTSLYIAPSKGGIFSTAQRAIMKSSEWSQA